jgi:thiamine kinase-like enzyme
MSDHSQEPVKYNKIVMLVHPFFDLMLSYRKSFLSRNIHRDNIDDNSVFSEDYLRKFKILLGAYGKALIEASKDPKACFIVVEPNFRSVLKSAYDPNIESMYYRITSKFFSRLKLFFDNKIYFTNFFPDANTSEIISQDLLNKLETKVKLESFGEYTEFCVNNWRNKHLKKFLLKNGFVVTESTTNKRFSIAIKPSDPFALNLNFIRMQRDRRRLRRKLISLSVRSKAA